MIDPKSDLAKDIQRSALSTLLSNRGAKTERETAGIMMNMPNEIIQEEIDRTRDRLRFLCGWLSREPEE